MKSPERHFAVTLVGQMMHTGTPNTVRLDSTSEWDGPHTTKPSRVRLHSRAGSALRESQPGTSVDKFPHCIQMTRVSRGLRDYVNQNRSRVG